MNRAPPLSLVKYVLAPRAIVILLDTVARLAGAGARARAPEGPRVAITWVARALEGWTVV